MLCTLAKQTLLPYVYARKEMKFTYRQQFEELIKYPIRIDLKNIRTEEKKIEFILMRSKDVIELGILLVYVWEA